MLRPRDHLGEQTLSRHPGMEAVHQCPVEQFLELIPELLDAVVVASRAARRIREPRERVQEHFDSYRLFAAQGVFKTHADVVRAPIPIRKVEVARFLQTARQDQLSKKSVGMVFTCIFGRKAHVLPVMLAPLNLCVDSEEKPSRTRPRRSHSAPSPMHDRQTNRIDRLTSHACKIVLFFGIGVRGGTYHTD